MTLRVERAAHAKTLRCAQQQWLWDLWVPLALTYGSPVPCAKPPGDPGLLPVPHWISSSLGQRRGEDSCVSAASSLCSLSDCDTAHSSPNNLEGLGLTEAEMEVVRAFLAGWPA